MESMGTLNATAASMMQKYESHGATDVTGFGLMGHAENLAAAQKGAVDIVFDAVPVITGMDKKVDGMPDFKVMQGYSAETSGGILTMLEPQKAKDFVSEMEQEHGHTSWIVGKVVSGSRKAVLREDATVIPVDSFIR